MESPGVCWMMVVGLVIAGVGHTNWQAQVVGDPSVRLPMEALWNFCGTVAEPTQQPLLPPWGRLSWCAGSGGEHTDGQAGPIAKLGQAHSVRSLSLRANVCFGGGVDVDGLLSGSWEDGVGVWLLSESGWGCTLYRWGDGRFACWADVLGVYVCLGGVTWSVKGSQGTMERTFVVEPAALLRPLIQKC